MEQRDTAVLFVDVSGSTRFFDIHGELEGRTMVDNIMKLAVPEVEGQKGRVVKFLGDGLLAVFPTSTDMIAAASAVHGLIAKRNEALEPASQIRIHSGGHFGPAVFDDDGDVFGDVVNVAARVQGVAGPDEIYVTDEAVETMAPSMRGIVRMVGRFPLRGKSEEMTLHEVMWEPTDATMVFSPDVRPKRVESLAVFRFEEQSHDLTPDKGKVTLGRIPGNDIVVDDSAVSREHAELFRRKGRVYLVDRSTNGTYLRPARGRPRHLHREELMVEGRGEISLGRPDGPPIHFDIH